MIVRSRVSKSPLSKKLLAPLALALVALPAVAHGGPAEPNAIQKKYVAREGVDGIQCKPTGALKELISGKYQCYGPKGAEKCGASFDAAKGTLSAEFLELYGDLLRTEKGAFLYSAGCKDLSGAEFAHFLAVGGVGYAKATQHLDALLALGSKESLAGMGADPRADLIAALGRFGDAHKQKIVPVLDEALAASGKLLGFKKNALKLLARFGSDDGVAYCKDVLEKGNDKDVTKVCAWYLAERKHAAAAPILVKRYEEDKKWFGRALGLLGAKDAIAVLKADYEKNAGSIAALPSTVALLNVGDKSYDYAADLIAMIEGRRPLSIKEREKKAEELKAKKKGAEDKWKKREAEAKEDVAQAAAIEATYVTDAAIAKKIDAALASTAKKGDWVKASAHAWSALAQRGDKAAVGELVKLLSSAKKDARDIAIDAFGARYDLPESFLEYVGRKGVVADASVPKALFDYVDSEPKEDLRANALLAIGAVRSFL